MENEITLCGDNCAYCPRKKAVTAKQLHEVAELWYRVGWREEVVRNSEICCNGCSSHKDCTYGLVDCTNEHKVNQCSECGEFPCEKIDVMVQQMKRYEKTCKEQCTKEEFTILEKSFFQKERNIFRIRFHVDLENYDLNGNVYKRSAVRGIIRKGEQYAMIRSTAYGEYKFPGGGMKEGERFVDTLIREVKEETGLAVVHQSWRYMGTAEERRKGERNDLLWMLSHYFYCQVEETIGAQQLDNYEKEYGYGLLFVNLEAAIKVNEQLLDVKQIPWTRRDTLVMKYLLGVE